MSRMIFEFNGIYFHYTRLSIEHKIVCIPSFYVNYDSFKLNFYKVNIIQSSSLPEGIHDCHINQIFDATKQQILNFKWKYNLLRHMFVKKRFNLIGVDAKTKYLIREEHHL